MPGGVPARKVNRRRMVGKRSTLCLAYNLHNYSNDVAAIGLQGARRAYFFFVRKVFFLETRSVLVLHATSATLVVYNSLPRHFFILRNANSRDPVISRWLSNISPISRPKLFALIYRNELFSYERDFDLKTQSFPSSLSNGITAGRFCMFRVIRAVHECSESGSAQKPRRRMWKASRIARGVAIPASEASANKTILLDRALPAGYHPQPASRDSD